MSDEYRAVDVDALLRLEWCSEGEAHFARFCAEGLADDGVNQRVATILFCAAARFLSLGHACVPLGHLADQTLHDEEGTERYRFPSLEQFRAAARKSLAVTWIEEATVRRGLSTPFVIDGQEQIFVARYFDHERRVAELLAALSRRPGQLVKDFDLDARLDHYFPKQSENEPEDLQKKAAKMALSQSFSLITGGPGTGKTSTVVKIIALLFERARAADSAVPTIQLLAPTGKAAARVMESVNVAWGQIDMPEQLKSEHLPRAATIHRALGTLPDNPTRFRRGPEQRLRADVVIVDEASMVDVALMRHLLSSLEENAQLLLLGDRFQLASVEAGSVLAELCAVFEGVDPSLKQHLTELRKSYRFAEESGIHALSKAFCEGDSTRALELLAAPSRDVRWIDPELGRAVGDGVTPDQCLHLRRVIVGAFSEALDYSTLPEVYAAMTQFRVLCAHRRGRFGAEYLNGLIERWLRAVGKLPSSGEFYRGRPILVTQNDYSVGLHNGDVGLCWPDGDRIAVYFPKNDGEYRALSPAKLPAHGTAFSMTVHKAQGSEHDEVVLLLPGASSQLLSRELVYTGVTRAKKRVVVWASPSAITRSVQQKVHRFTGLGEALTSNLSATKTPKMPPDGDENV